MANWISLLRVIFCLIIAGLLVSPEPTATLYGWLFVGTIIVIWMDGLDGYVARKFNESSKMGAVIDIIGDRVVEQVYWIVFLALGWVPLWMPLVVIIRGVVVDGIRSIGMEQGYTAFGESSMMKSPLGILLVSSRFSRWSYAALKAILFSFMIVVYAPEPGLMGWMDPVWQQGIATLTTVALYGTVFFCVVRGLPVLLEGARFFQMGAPGNRADTTNDSALNPQ